MSYDPKTSCCDKCNRYADEYQNCRTCECHQTTPHTDAQECCEKCFDSREAHTVDGVYFPPQEFCKQSNCPCHTPHTPSSDWEEDYEIVRNRFTVYDTSLHTYVINDEKLKSFIHTHIENARREERERIIAEIENDPQIPIPRPYEVAWILTKLQLHDVTNKE